MSPGVHLGRQGGLSGSASPSSPLEKAANWGCRAGFHPVYQEGCKFVLLPSTRAGAGPSRWMRRDPGGATGSCPEWHAHRVSLVNDWSLPRT